MGKKRKYVSPLLLQLVVDDDPTIIIGGSMDTGGIGECFEETAMFSGQYGAEVYFLGEDGEKTLVGYHQVIEGTDDYDTYYDLDGNPIDLTDYWGFDEWVGWEFGLWCDDSGFGGF